MQEFYPRLSVDFCFRNPRYKSPRRNQLHIYTHTYLHTYRGDRSRTRNRTKKPYIPTEMEIGNGEKLEKKGSFLHSYTPTEIATEIKAMK